MFNMFYAQDFFYDDEFKGSKSIDGILNVNYEYANGVLTGNVNIKGIFDVGSFTLTPDNTTEVFTQGSEFNGYSLLFVMDPDEKVFFVDGYVRLPLVPQLNLDNYIIYDWN